MVEFISLCIHLLDLSKNLFVLCKFVKPRCLIWSFNSEFRFGFSSEQLCYRAHNIIQIPIFLLHVTLSFLLWQLVQSIWEPLVLMGDVLGHPWQMVETSSPTMHFLKKNMGASAVWMGGWVKEWGVGIEWELLACRMRVYWQGVRVHIEHDVHARELDFLKGWREVTMVYLFSAAFKWPPYNRTFCHLLWTQRTFWPGAIFEAASAVLSLILVSSIHMGYDEP